MKRLYILLFFIAICSVRSYAQCDDDDFLDNCATLLDDYTFIKSFNIELAGKAGDESNITELSYVFSKDHSYVLTACDLASTGGAKLIVELYDRNHKLVASSYSRSTKKSFPKIGYSCSATGVYYIKAYFEDNKNGCGVTILGFKNG